MATQDWNRDADLHEWNHDLDAFAAHCRSTGELEALERALWPVLVFERLGSPAPVCRVHNVGPGPALDAHLWLAVGLRGTRPERASSLVLGTVHSASFVDVPLDVVDRHRAEDEVVSVRLECLDLFGRRHPFEATIQRTQDRPREAARWRRARRRTWRDVLERTPRR
jgi:hypothetical protein